jgi:hypothetical protein
MQSLSDGRIRAYVQPLISVTCHDNSTNTCVDDNLFVDKNVTRAEPPGVGASAADTAAGGEAPGLVSSKTSGMSGLSHRERMAVLRSVQRLDESKKMPGDAILIDREASRLKRLKHSVLTAARLHGEQRSKWRCLMLTLTYRPDVDWAAGQISDLVRHIRQYLKRRSIDMRFVWVQEFTKKGRPHYHILIWLPAGRSLPKPDKQGWWPYGMTKIEWVRYAVGYIAKYASKADSLHLPAKGARMHGNGGLTEGALLEQRWWKLPSWLRSDVEPSDRLRRAPTGSGGGFVHPETGERYISPWEVFFTGGFVYIKRRVVQ